jgi:hypothetical protein
MAQVVSEKLKARQFFKAEHIPQVRAAVAQHHYITSYATLLLKSFYLNDVLPRWREGVETAFPISADVIQVAFTIVQGKKVQTRKRRTSPDEQAEQPRQGPWWHGALLDRWNAAFDTARGCGIDKRDALALSYPFDYAATQLAAAYETNIEEHFPGYVQRYVKESLRRLPGQPTAAAAKKAFSADIDRAVRDVFLGRLTAPSMTCRVPEIRAWVRDNGASLLPPRPPGFQCLEEHLEADPWSFLPFMVDINLRLEGLPRGVGRSAGAAKLFHPLCLRKSFVPGAMVLDTTALLHLLLRGKDDLKVFKDDFLAFYGVDLVNLRDKSNVAASLATLTGRSGVTKDEEAEHAQRVWSYFAKLDAAKDKHAGRLVSHKRKDGTAFRFARFVRTDGYTVSAMLTTAKDTLGRKRVAKARKVYMHSLNESTWQNHAATFLPAIENGQATAVGCDPGKKDLVTLVDGSGRALAYSKARRDRECRFKATEERRTNSAFFRVLKGSTLSWTAADGSERRLESPNVSAVLSDYLGSFNSKSSRPATFDAYIQARQRVDGLLRPFFEAAFHRHAKYSVFLAKRASQDRLVDRIRNTFGGGRGCGGQPKGVLIFWGNWGARPNGLKGSPSTPGIGLRRFVHRRLCKDRWHGQTVSGSGTLTTFEGKTSSACSACGGRVEEGRDRKGQLTRRVLQCSCCGARHARDVMGAQNILQCGMSLLVRGERPAHLAKSRGS